LNFVGGPEMQSKELSTTFEKVRIAEGNIDDHFREANEIAEAVTNFLKSA
jgi:hypothetical protein